MKTKLTIIITVTLIIISEASYADSKNYKYLKQEFQSYDTSLFYKESAVEPSSVPAVKGKITASELSIKEKELERRKQKWDEIIKKVYTVKIFFDFETQKSKRIRKIAATEEIKNVLKQEIDIDTLISAAYERNPGLKAAKIHWKSTLEKYSQTTRLDNIMGQYQSFIKDLNTKIGPMKHKSSIRNKFPFPGILALKGDIVEKEVMISREKYLIALKNLITGLTVNYDELIFVNGAISIMSENLRLLKDLESTASIKYSTGSASFNDVIKAQIEISKLATDLAILKEKKKKVIAKLNEYLDIPSAFPLGDTVRRNIKELKASLKELYDVGIKNQQELKILNLKIEKTNLAITLAEKKFYPDFTLGFSYFEKDSFQLNPVTMTSFWFGKNDAYVREARLRYQKLKKKLTEAENKLFFDVSDIFFHLDKSEKNIRLYANSLHAYGNTGMNIAQLEPHSLLAQAKKAIDVAEIEYEAGKIDFLNLLDAQKKFLDFSLNYIKAVKEHNQSFAMLERIIGVRLN